MDDSVILDDEVIADSEEENEKTGGFSGQGSHQLSPFSAFTTQNQYYKPTTHSSISNFTAGPSVIADYSSRIESSERDSRRNTDAETSIASLSRTYSNLDDIASSIADRAKTRQRPKNPSTSLDVIELTSDEEDDELSLKPSKPRPKPKPKLKIKLIPKEKEQPVQVDPPQPAAAAAPPRPRPRPRPRVKRTVPDAEVIAPFPPTSTPPSELPIATSSPRPAHTVTSQLPPSDPPLPSPGGMTYSDDPNTRVPPIEALFNGPLSSPNSLFSAGEKTSRKRKRNPPASEREVDELDSDQELPQRPYMMYDSSPHRMPPPPTFFAGSSSSSIGRERHGAAPDVLTPSPPEPEVVDLTMLPPTLVPAPKPKPKKPKKKMDLSMFDENYGNTMIVLDEDNRDDDFDPRGEGSSKKKKTKAKVKEKPPAKSRAKAAKSASDERSDTTGKDKIVEVVLDPRPSSKGKGKAKSDGTPISKPSGKGKAKESSTSANKDVFKSREFIEDSDDELDVLPRGGTAAGSVSAYTPSSLASTKANPPAPFSKSATSSSSKPKERSPLRLSSPPSDLDSETGDTGKAAVTKRSVSSAKKRKSIVDSEAEDDDFATAVIRVTPSSTTTVKKRKMDGKKKGKNVVLSDDEEDDRQGEEETIVQTGKRPKASKQSKKVVHDEEDEEVDADARKKSSIRDEQQSTPKEIKENVVPATSKSSVAPTPRPNVVPKPSMPSTNSEHKTPIYTRYEIAPRKSSLPMSELIRRANSMPGSPFPATPSAIGPSRLKGLGGRAPLAYSPLLKSSRSMLSRIAPLHPNRRTPPPPPPPPPPRKKSKKELELEEKWEEEMVESVGGMEAWAVLGDDERREIRKAKWARELGGWDE